MQLYQNREERRDGHHFRFEVIVDACLSDTGATAQV
jgi:hypothetical protein